MNVHGRGVTLHFQTNLIEFIYARISACAYFGGKQERCVFTMSLCALIYNKFRLITHASPTKIMTIGDEVQHAVYSWVSCDVIHLSEGQLQIETQSSE